MAHLDAAMRRMQHGDAHAIEDLYHDLQRPIYFYLLSLVRRPALAEDLSQDVFVQMYAKAKLYQIGTNVKAWAFTIARNLALNALQLDKREVLMDVSVQEQMLGSEEMMIDEGSPTIELAMKLLTEEEFRILSLILFAELKRREVAVLLDQPLPTITWKYHQALAKLREKLASTS